MAGHTGTLKDSNGDPLYPASLAEQISVTVNGQQRPLSVVLQEIGLTPAVVTESEHTLELSLDPGDLYSVPSYIVGNHRIQMWRDGVYLHGGETGMWQEYGDAGTVSSVILINDKIPAQSVLTVRVTG